MTGLFQTSSEAKRYRFPTALIVIKDLFSFGLVLASGSAEHSSPMLISLNMFNVYHFPYNACVENDTKTSITQRFRNNLGRSVEEETITQQM